MANLVSHDIRLREISRGAESLVKVSKERKVEIHLAIGGAIERPDFRTSDAAGRLRGAVEQHEDGGHIRLATVAEDLTPGLFRIGEDNGNEFCLWILVVQASGADRLILRGAGGADEVERIGSREGRKEEKKYESSDASANREAHTHPHSPSILNVSASGSSLPFHVRAPPRQQMHAGYRRERLSYHSRCMDLGLTDKIAVITGSSRRLGLASARS